MSSQEIIQISLGKFQVGITGLKEAIDAVLPLKDRPDAEIAQALLEMLKPRNYIPASAENDYRQALLREFKKALGFKVEEETGGLTIRFISPSCPCSEDFLDVLLAVLSELGLPADVEHVTDLAKIAASGASGTPALIINGQVKAVGRMPSKEILKGWLTNAT